MNNILEQANNIVNNRTEEADRNYGPMNEGMDKTAKFATLMGNKKLTAIDCFRVLIGLKQSRESYCHKEDNLLDMVAYTGALNNYIQENKYNVKMEMYKDLWENGVEINPRGELTKELLNYSFELEPYDRFYNFEGRKFNLSYLKNEMLWYLKGGRFDTSITKHAKMWNTLINKDGSINSNYGQYINPNIERIIKTLAEDKNSRRAVISIGNNVNYNSKTNDYCCCQYLSFIIRNNQLLMNVQFRSSDIIFGITNDIPTMSIYQEIIYVILRDEYYPDLKMGNLHFFTNSLHIYERHYIMIQKIIKFNNEMPVKCPKIVNNKEARLLLTNGGIKSDFPFSKWIQK